MENTTLAKEKNSMGRVTVPIKIENTIDLADSLRGYIAKENERSIEIEEALVDTGATTLCLPSGMIQKLGLTLLETRKVNMGSGKSEVNVYGPAQVTVLDRRCRVDVFELPDNVSPLLGYIPLEWMDLLVDPKNGKLIPNPKHGDEMILDLL